MEIALANTQGTRSLLEHTRATDARFLYASTSEVYGDPEVHPQSEGYNGNVNIRGVRGCYDESKRFGETLVEAFIRKYDVDARTVRIFNTYGPRMRPNDGRVVPTFLSQALNGEDLTVYGEGTQTRCFCYVDDMISAIETVLHAPSPEHDVYNVGNDNEISILELADLVVELTEGKIGITHEQLPEDDPQRRKPDVSRLQSEFDWEPETPLREGLSKTINYFESQMDNV